MIGCTGLEGMPGAGVILAFFEQQAAQGQPVKLLLACQFARGNAFQRPQRGLPFALALLLKDERQSAQFAFTVAQSGADGGKRGVVVKQGLKVPREETFELFRSPVHGFSNAHKDPACTQELALSWKPMSRHALSCSPDSFILRSRSRNGPRHGMLSGSERGLSGKARYCSGVGAVLFHRESIGSP